MASGVAAPPPLNAMPSLLHPKEEVTASPITQTASVSNSVYPSTLWECLPRIKLSEIIPEDGAPSVEYLKSIDALWDCLTTHGAAVLETCPEDAALLRCALESAKIHFRTNHNRSISPPGLPQTMSQFVGYIGSSSKEMYYYRAGRNVSGEGDHPPCMSDVYRYLGRASRAALAAICRHLHLRSDAFWSLLDDCPLPRNEISSSVLLATHFRDSIPDGGSAETVKCHEEFEMGFITLIASDSPGFQVLNSNGSWYVADIGLRAGDLLLVTGKALEHVTTGLCKAHAHRVIPFSSSSVPGFSKRVSLTFCLMPRDTAIWGGSAMAEAGHVSSAGFKPIYASKFLKNLSNQDSAAGLNSQKQDKKPYTTSDSALRSLLSDPMTGDLLEDAFTAIDCGHTFGGGTLKRVKETGICSSCGVSVKVESMIPNLVLRAVAVAFDRDERRRRAQFATRKRKKQLLEKREKKRRMKENKSHHKNQEIYEEKYPFKLNEKVLIKGNKRTPEKLVGREAFITSKCLNGWYLLKLADNGENVRLQLRSLQAIHEAINGIEECVKQEQSPDNAEIQDDTSKSLETRS